MTEDAEQPSLGSIFNAAFQVFLKLRGSGLARQRQDILFRLNPVLPYGNYAFVEKWFPYSLTDSPVGYIAGFVRERFYLAGVENPEVYIDGEMARNFLNEIYFDSMLKAGDEDEEIKRCKEAIEREGFGEELHISTMPSYDLAMLVAVCNSAEPYLGAYQGGYDISPVSRKRLEHIVSDNSLMWWLSHNMSGGRVAKPKRSDKELVMMWRPEFLRPKLEEIRKVMAGRAIL